jgi:dihydroneopterin aldolase
MGIIGIEGLKIEGLIGCDVDEHQIKQEIRIDLKVEADLSRCALSDELHDTINYVRLAEICQEVLQEKHHRLIEALGQAILERIVGEFPVSWIWIKIRKPGALKQAEASFVELEHGLGISDGRSQRARGGNL